MTRITGLWKSKGKVFAKGTISFDELVKLVDSAKLYGKKCNILIFENTEKAGPKSPDYSLSLAEDTKQEGQPNV